MAWTLRDLSVHPQDVEATSTAAAEGSIESGGQIVNFSRCRHTVIQALPDIVFSYRQNHRTAAPAKRSTVETRYKLMVRLPKSYPLGELSTYRTIFQW